MVQLEPHENHENYGKLIVVSKGEALSGEDVLNRMQSIINIIKAVDVEQIEQSDLFFLVSILEDYLPTPEQALKMIEILPKKK